MRFSSTVDSLSRENRYLRRINALLAVGLCLSTLGVLLLYDKAPSLVMRSSRGLEIVNLTPLKQTAPDLNQAVALMLKARLDTDTISPEVYLSDRQRVLRQEEQREFKSRGLSQAIVIRAVHLRDGAATAELDRVISLGEIRSAIKASVSLVFEAIEPNELNPYGLRLATLAPLGVAQASDGKPHEGENRK